ncbi:MAG: outer membrane beta-barrel protein [Gammaproteobacteria bacterium]|nr:outer membrane beta-barrel protein [Gammaproteobacteria bacterium]
MNKTVTVMVMGLMLTAAQASAESLDTNKIYLGGGIGFNDINDNYYDDDAVGFQVFAGIPLPVKTESVELSVELGYMDSGDFDRSTPSKSTRKVNGLWGAAVAELPLNNNNVSLLGRLGLDIGDDDGLMAGVGIGFAMSQKMDLRLEYVSRDHIDSLQLNLVFRQ